MVFLTNPIYPPIKKNWCPPFPYTFPFPILPFPPKNPLTDLINPLPKSPSLPNQHKLKQLRNALRKLVDLRARCGVKDSEAGVDMPLVGVDAQH